MKLLVNRVQHGIADGSQRTGGGGELRITNSCLMDSCMREREGETKEKKKRKKNKT